MNRVAVLIPVYNGPEGLSATLASLSAACGEFDVVLVDDGSDPPVQVATQPWPFQLVLLRHDRNAGIAAALNKGLRYIHSCRYEYVARLDAYDRLLTNRLVSQVSFLDTHPDHAIVGSDVDFVDWKGRPLYRYGPQLHHEAILHEMRYRPSFIHPAVMIRVEALERVGDYSEMYPGGEDYELFLRLLRHHKGANLPEILLHVYLDPHGISISQRRQLIRTRFQLQVENFSMASPHSYLGILRTALLALMPYQLLYAIKRLVRPVLNESS